MKTYRYLCTVIALVATLHLNIYAITEAENKLIGEIHSGSISGILEILKTQKPDVNVIGPDEATPLNWAIYRDNPNAVHLLINYGLQLPTYLKPDQPHENPAIQLLHDYALMLRQARNNPTKALFDQAVERGFVPVVKLLLEKDIQVNAGDLKRAKDLYTQTDDIVKQDAYKLIGALLVKHLMPQAGVLPQLPLDIQNYIATFLHSEIPAQEEVQ